MVRLMHVRRHSHITNIWVTFTQTTRCAERASKQSQGLWLGVPLLSHQHKMVASSSLISSQTSRTPKSLPSLRHEFPQIPLEMSECLLELLSKAAENRPASAVEAVQLLSAVLGETEDLDQLMQSAFAHQPGVKWKRQGDCYRVNLQFNDGRRQLVLVEPSEHAAADRTLRISSVCCPALSVYFEPALRLNSEILHGALAIAEIDGEAMFLMVDNYPRATVDPEEIRRSVLEVAHRADAIEKLLTGNDLN